MTIQDTCFFVLFFSFLFLAHHLNGDWGCQSLQSWSIENAVKSNGIKIFNNTDPPHQPRSTIPAITFSHQSPHHDSGSSHGQAGGGLAFTSQTHTEVLLLLTDAPSC